MFRAGREVSKRGSRTPTSYLNILKYFTSDGEMSRDTHLKFQYVQYTYLGNVLSFPPDDYRLLMLVTDVKRWKKTNWFPNTRDKEYLGSNLLLLITAVAPLYAYAFPRSIPGVTRIVRIGRVVPVFS